MNNWQAFILSIIEGLSEFLPISSTAHLIVSEELLGIESSKFLNFFTIFIQLGAICAVPILYFKRLLSGIKIYSFVTISFIPAVVFGLLLNDFLESMFEGYYFIAVSWIIGGIILLKIDVWINNKDEGMDLVESLNSKNALLIGLYQCIAMIPGVSRSGATIVGGRLSGLSHKNAVEYSFLLAIPTLLGATAKKLLDYRDNFNELFTTHTMGYLGIGFIGSFIVALLTIQWLVGFIKKKGISFFGYYRIIIGVLLLIYLWLK
jgi:undecaprenyl-diphosphatase